MTIAAKIRTNFSRRDVSVRVLRNAKKVPNLIASVRKQRKGYRDNSPLHPLQEETGRLERHCKLPLHIGIGRVRSQADLHHPLQKAIQHWKRISGKRTLSPAEVEFNASCLVPATGNCLIFLRNQSGLRLNRVFGEGLIIQGDSADGRFDLICPQFYIKATSSSGEEPAWAIASPVNCMITIVYGEPRRIARVTAIINNFDFEYGNWPTDANHPQREKILRVEASGRLVDFTWREGHGRLRHLLDVGLLHSTSFVTFSFDTWEGSSEDDMTTFAHSIASLCSIVARQHTGIPVLSFLDRDGRIVKRLLGNAIESEYRKNYILRCLHAEVGLPKLFLQCFDGHVKMQQSDLWRRLPWLCAGIEDPPYLEQKCATLMSALELLIRSSLIEDGHYSTKQAQKIMFPGLISAARKKLVWDIPPHYTAGERYRLLRNAVSHGDHLPGEVKQVRHDFDKWALFLLRRFLLRLGFDGDVASPDQGFISTSAVDDFSEEHNSFER